MKAIFPTVRNDQAYIITTKQLQLFAINHYLLLKMSCVRTVRHPDTLGMPVSVAVTHIFAREHDLLVHLVRMHEITFFHRTSSLSCPYLHSSCSLLSRMVKFAEDHRVETKIWLFQRRAPKELKLRYESYIRDSAQLSSLHYYDKTVTIPCYKSFPFDENESCTHREAS